MNIPIYRALDELKKKVASVEAENKALIYLLEKQGKELEKYEAAICIKISKWSFAIFILVVICFVIAYCAGV